MAPKGTLSSRAAGLILLPGAGRRDVKVPVERSGQQLLQPGSRRKTATVYDEVTNLLVRGKKVNSFAYALHIASFVVVRLF
jgi:hypothetical protein